MRTSLVIMALLCHTAISGHYSNIIYIPCDEGPSVDAVAIAEVLYCECRGEPAEGWAYVVDAIRNRAEKYKESIWKTTRHGMCRGKLEHRTVELVEKMLKKPVGHQYHYWYNPKTATDRKWIKKTSKWKSETVGRHKFF